MPLRHYQDMLAADVPRLADYCRSTLTLSSAALPDEYGYRHLSLCAIDAVFSIGVNYTSTQNTVHRFCRYVGITSADKGADAGSEFAVGDLVALYRASSVEYLATEVYQNRQRTSVRNGILKAEAVLRVAETLLRFGVNHKADVEGVMGHSEFEAAFRQIPGQTSGISLRYFYMLAGSEHFVKPDRMIVRFLEAALGRTVSVEECHPLLLGVCAALHVEFPTLSPRSLDNMIWQYQRARR